MESRYFWITILLSAISFNYLYAQDENEFQRITKRIMDAYDTGEELQHAPDSAKWFGGAYLGASSKGRAMPSVYFTYLPGDRLLFTGNLSMDLSELTTKSSSATDFLAGGSSMAETTTLTRYTKQDASLRLDYRPWKSDIFTVGFIEGMQRRKIEDNTIKNGCDAAGISTEAEYEEQVRSNNDLKLGWLLQHIHEFASAGKLTSRVNLKYNSKPTDIAEGKWGAASSETASSERQNLYNFDPYFMLRFQSRSWKGISFGIEEKFTIEDMRITDSQTRFNYNTNSWLTTVNGNFKYKWFSAKMTAQFDRFSNTVDSHSSAGISHTYNDWLADVSTTFKLNGSNAITLGYKRDISRPSYTQLYPFVHIGSSIGVMVVGNPSLQPSTGNQVKLSHTYLVHHLKLTSSITYRRIDDDITKVSSYDESSQRSVKTWINDARYDILKFAVEGNVNYGRFDMSMGVRAQHLQYGGNEVSGDDSWSWSFKFRPRLKLPSNWTTAAVILYTGRDVHRYYYDRSNMYLALRAVKEIGPWAMYTIVQDILQQDHEQVLRNSKQNMLTTDKLNSRAIIVGCSYRF